MRNSYADHIEDDLLERYSLELLRGADMAYVEEHLLICLDCRSRLETFDTLARHGKRCGTSSTKTRAKDFCEPVEHT
ncbi:MAG: hypothetical protein ACM336_05915 [Acidobacteriota bacterium]